MSRLHWISVEPTHYHAFFFRSFVQQSSVELLVHHLKSRNPRHPWRSEFTRSYPNRTCDTRLGLDWHLLRLALRRSDTVFLIASWNDPTSIALINELALLKQPFVLWTDTPDTGRKRGFLKAVLRQRWLRHVFARAYKVLGTGRPAIAALTRMGCAPDKLESFPFWVDLEGFRPREIAYNAGPLVFLSAGALVNSHKGYDVALRALGLLKREGVLDDFVYRIAGTGCDEALLRQLAAEQDLTHNVEFVGWLEPDEVATFHRTGVVFLHPSRFDPFPNAVLEAMASGLAVISSDLAGSAVERIEPPHNGLIHRAGDHADLAEKIRYVVKNPSAAQGMGRAARKRAEEWPVQRGVKMIEQLVEHALATTRR